MLKMVIMKFNTKYLDQIDESVFNDKHVHVSTDIHVQQAGTQLNTKERIYLNMAYIPFKKTSDMYTNVKLTRVQQTFVMAFVMTF